MWLKSSYFHTQSLQKKIIVGQLSLLSEPKHLEGRLHGIVKALKIPVIFAIVDKYQYCAHCVSIFVALLCLMWEIWS